MVFPVPRTTSVPRGRRPLQARTAGGGANAEQRTTYKVNTLLSPGLSVSQERYAIRNAGTQRRSFAAACLRGNANSL